MAVLGCRSLVLVIIIRDGEMDTFYNPSKIFKPVQFTLINVGTSKKH